MGGFVKGLCSVCSLLSVGWLSEGDGVPPWSSVRDGDGDQTTTASGLLVLPLGWSLTSVLPLSWPLGWPLVSLLSQLPASTASLGWSPVGGRSLGSGPPGGGPPGGRSPSTESSTAASDGSLLLFVGGGGSVSIISLSWGTVGFLSGSTVALVGTGGLVVVISRAIT